MFFDCKHDIKKIILGRQ